MEIQDNTKQLKHYLQQGNYNKCSQILEEIIINHIVNLIKKTDKTYEYTNIIDLINDSEFYLKDDNRYIASKIYFFDVEENDVNRLERLLYLCETYNISYN